jgi:hypothetical protein
LKRRFYGRVAPKQAFSKTKHKQKCWCAEYKHFEDAPDYMRQDWDAKPGYSSVTGTQNPRPLLKKCKQCRGKKWYWRTTKELLYQCFGGPVNGQFKSMKEAGDDYTQYNRAARAGLAAQKAILVWDGGHLAVPE